jgi:hypothetical protein
MQPDWHGKDADKSWRRWRSAAQENAESVIALCAEHGFSQILAIATSLRGWAKAEQGAQRRGDCTVTGGSSRVSRDRIGIVAAVSSLMLAEMCMETGIRACGGAAAITE